MLEGVGESFLNVYLLEAVLPIRGLPLDDEHYSRKDQAQQSNGFLFHLMTLFCNPDILPPLLSHIPCALSSSD